MVSDFDNKSKQRLRIEAKAAIFHLSTTAKVSLFSLSVEGAETQTHTQEEYITVMNSTTQKKTENQV